MLPAVPTAEQLLNQLGGELNSLVFMGSSSIGAAFTEYFKSLEGVFRDCYKDKDKPVAEIVAQVTGTLDRVFEGMKVKRKNDDQPLHYLNDHIKEIMTSLVHSTSGYAKTDQEGFDIFANLLNQRSNEAIITQVFTFFFNEHFFSVCSPESLRGITGHFWNCHVLISSHPRPLPYYANRVWKILSEKIYRQYNTRFIELFEKYSKEIAEQSSAEKRKHIESTLRRLRARKGLPL